MSGLSKGEREALQADIHVAYLEAWYRARASSLPAMQRKPLACGAASRERARRVSAVGTNDSTASPLKPALPTLQAAIAALIARQQGSANDLAHKVAAPPDDVIGQIGKMLQLSKIERRARREEIYAAYIRAWQIAGGLATPHTAARRQHRFYEEPTPRPGPTATAKSMRKAPVIQPETLFENVPPPTITLRDLRRPKKAPGTRRPTVSDRQNDRDDT